MKNLIKEIERILEVGEFEQKVDIFAEAFEYVEKEKKVCRLCINKNFVYEFDEFRVTLPENNLDKKDCGSIKFCRNKERIGWIDNIDKMNIEIIDIFKSTIHVTLK